MASYDNSYSSMRIIIVAGEASGDALAADLIHKLREKKPALIIEGIAGHKMIEAGCKMLFPLERLSVMGIIEPIKRLPEILSIRSKLKKYILEKKPDLFIGVDSPDFNLGLEMAIRQAGIRTIHYVSPTVWAWRSGRIKKIKRAVDLMLTLLPFEEKFYVENQVPVKFVGHPIADQIPLEPDSWEARKKLNLPMDAKILAIMPGSRSMELKKIAETFIRTAQVCLAKNPHLKIITSMVNDERTKQFQEILKKTAPQLPITIFQKRSHEVMLASEVVLLASGTITLEAMLLKRPMVVAYNLNFLTFWIAKLLVNKNIKHVSLPNLLAQKELVPEFLQHNMTVENLSRAVLERLNNLDLQKQLKTEFTKLHRELKQNASQRAADILLGTGPPL